MYNGIRIQEYQFYLLCVTEIISPCAKLSLFTGISVTFRYTGIYV
jgi:hypothetical protein